MSTPSAGRPRWMYSVLASISGTTERRETHREIGPVGFHLLIVLDPFAAKRLQPLVAVGRRHSFPLCKAFKPVGWAKSNLARSDSTSKGGKTGENGGCEVAGSVAMRCAILCVIGRQFPSSNLRPEPLRETWLPSFEANLCCSN